MFFVCCTKKSLTLSPKTPRRLCLSYTAAHKSEYPRFGCMNTSTRNSYLCRYNRTYPYSSATCSFTSYKPHIYDSNASITAPLTAHGNLNRLVAPHPLPPSTQRLQHALQWLDLRSHLRLREANSVSRKEVPRWTTTLVTRGCNAAQRCHDKILTGGKTFIRSITVDLSPKPSSSASSSFSYPTSLRNVCLDISAGHTLPLLVREHRPAEFRVHNMVHGGEFSGALLALEENLAPVRRDLRVLQLGLSTGGPRPYQDPRAHHWCMLRLRRLLGAAVGDSGGKVVRELAELTRALDTAVWHLVGVRFAERVESAASACGAADEVFLRKSCWPRLTELRLSCGIMGGDLEGLAECLGG